jgi:pimeloyl-[acyl-carrier protein] synthase
VTSVPGGDVRFDRSLSLCQLLDPQVLANPYPLYKSLRECDPVHWDPFLHAWIVTRYDDVVTILQKFTAARTPTPEQLNEMGLAKLKPLAQVMVGQMLFMDGQAHMRLRGLCSAAFASRRIEALRSHIAVIADRLLDRVIAAGRMDVIRDFANPLPAVVTAELLGVDAADHEQLKRWSADFAELLGNFQHNPDHADQTLQSLDEMARYFRAAIRAAAGGPGEGLIRSLLTAEVDGSRLTEDEIVANLIITMVGGQETTTNLIGNGLVTLLDHPEQMVRLRDEPALMELAVEELLRYESPSQHTARITPEDQIVGGKHLKKRDAVIAVMAAANRDPDRFAEPDRLDLARLSNRHLAFGWGPHFCFGAPLARMEGQIAFSALLHRLRNIQRAAGRLEWRENLGLRGLKALPITFAAA